MVKLLDHMVWECAMNEEKNIDWCEEKKLAIINTWFAAQPKQRYT